MLCPQHQGVEAFSCSFVMCSLGILRSETTPLFSSSYTDVLPKQRRCFALPTVCFPLFHLRYKGTQNIWYMQIIIQLFSRKNKILWMYQYKYRLSCHKTELFQNKRPLLIFNFQFNKVFREVLTSQRQLMMRQIGQHLLQLQEEAFARFVTVGVHVKFSWEFSV